ISWPSTPREPLRLAVPTPFSCPEGQPRRGGPRIMHITSVFGKGLGEKFFDDLRRGRLDGTAATGGRSAQHTGDRNEPRQPHHQERIGGHRTAACRLRLG